MKAIYYQPGPVQLDVIGKPKDGCADLGRGKDILVKGVPIDDSKAAGTCKLVEEPKVKAAKTEEPAKNEDSSEEEGKAAEEAAEQAAK